MNQKQKSNARHKPKEEVVQTTQAVVKYAHLVEMAGLIVNAFMRMPWKKVQGSMFSPTFDVQRHAPYLSKGLHFTRFDVPWLTADGVCYDAFIETFLGNHVNHGWPMHSLFWRSVDHTTSTNATPNYELALKINLDKPTVGVPYTAIAEWFKNVEFETIVKGLARALMRREDTWESYGRETEHPLFVLDPGLSTGSLCQTKGD